MGSNTAVTTPTVPLKMAVPTVVNIDPLSIGISFVQLTSLVDIGYETITGYYVQKCIGTGCTVMT